MPLEQMMKVPLRRLNPHRGMVVDVSTWSAAHDYHRLQQRLHSLSLHSPGLVAGLEMVAWDPPDNSVVVHRGVAIDSEGNTIILAEPQRFNLLSQDAGTAYLVVRYREVAEETVQGTTDGETQTKYTLEGYTLEERRQLPAEPYVELGRIEMSGSGTAISNATDLSRPGQDEIDLRYRLAAGHRVLGQVSIGLLPLETLPTGEVRHQAGAAELVRAINATTGYRAELKGLINLNQEISDCHLVIMAGQQQFTLTEAWEGVLLKFLDRGGVLLGESCGAGTVGTDGAVAFQQSFVDLTVRLGRRLATVERGHDLFNSCHLFAEPPEGVEGPSHLLTDNGIVYSDGDFGCLWSGGRPEQSAARSSIRSAIELGTNLGIFAHRRLHLHSVRLGALNA